MQDFRPTNKRENQIWKEIATAHVNKKVEESVHARDACQVHAKKRNNRRRG